MVQRKLITPPEEMWLSDEEIQRLKDLKLEVGKRAHRREINAQLKELGIEWECPYSIISADDGLYAIYRDNDKNQPFILGDGAYGHVKVLQKLDKEDPDKNNWVFKTIFEDKMCEALGLRIFDREKSKQELIKIATHEANVSQKMGLGKSILIQTVSRKTKQEKRGIILKKAKGKDSFALIATRELPTDAMILQKIAYNILKKLKKIHTKHFIVRDLSLENIMIAGEKVEFIDFGAWLEHKDGQASDKFLPCKDGYKSPQIQRISDKYIFTFESDIYAAAIVIQALLTGRIPQPGNQFVDDQIKRTKAGKKYKLEPEIAKLIEKMMNKKAPTLETACEVIKNVLEEYKQEEFAKQEAAVPKTVSKSKSSSKSKKKKANSHQVVTQALSSDTSTAVLTTASVPTTTTEVLTTALTGAAIVTPTTAAVTTVPPIMTPEVILPTTVESSQQDGVITDVEVRKERSLELFNDSRFLNTANQEESFVKFFLLAQKREAAQQFESGQQKNYRPKGYCTLL